MAWVKDQVKRYGNDSMIKKAIDAATKRGEVLTEEEAREATFEVDRPEYDSYKEFDTELVADLCKFIQPTRKPQKGSHWDKFGEAVDDREALFRWIVKHQYDSLRESQRRVADPVKRKAKEIAKKLSTWTPEKIAQLEQLLDENAAK